MKNYIRLIIISLLFSFLSGCLEDPEYSIVSVITNDEVEYIEGGVILKGEIETENFLRTSIETLGFCYSLEKEPTVSDSTIVLEKPMWGEYSAILSDLKEGTKYFVRAFAQNKYGVVYGEEIYFTSLTRPKVSTIDVSENDNHVLLVKCELISVGSDEVDLLGVCYSINNSEPTLEKDSLQEVTTIKKGVYEITYPINANTKYYVRAVAQNLAGVAYGPVKEIVTKKQTYTITFNSNDGTTQSNSMKVNSMETNMLPANTFDREGYTFIGWNTEADGSGVSYYDKQSITLNNNITLYAQWRPNSHMIIFKSNGASGNMPSVEIKYNNSYTIPSNTFTYTGYTFIGWNTSTDGTGITYYEDQTITIKSDLTLYAQWEKKSYNITFYSNGGSGSMQSAKVNYLESYVIPTNLYTRTGYKFVGWNTLANGNGTSYSQNQKITITGNLTLYAQWKKIYTVTFYANGGTGNMSVLSVASLEKFILPINSFVREGYTFVNWNTEADGRGVSYDNKAELMIAGNLTLYAQWAEKSYTITYNSNGGSGSMQSDQKKYQDSYTLKSNNFTNTGHTFVGWNTKADGTGTSYSVGQTITISNDLTLYAQWEKITYTITFYANGGTGTMQNEKVKYLESYSLPSNKFTRTGYVFVGWNTMSDGSGKSYSNGQSVALSANLLLYAIWEKQTLPVVTTSSVTGISTNSATCGGTISSFDYTITERGVCYGTSSSPTIFNSVVKNGSGTGTYSCSLSGLNSGTTYYVRAYAKYSGGVIYGDVKSFRTLTLPVVTTSSVSNISTNSVTCGGTVSSSDYTIIERGICYATHSNPTISSNTWYSSSSTATFNCTISGLTENTTYYYRAFARYSGGVVYGDVMSFTTYVSPKVTTSNVSDITSTSAFCGGYVSSLYYDVTERGICYSTSSTPTISNSVVKNGSGTGTYSCTLSGLNSGTTYYVRAYAKYSGAVIYGDIKSFSTLSLPVVTTSSVSNISTNSVTCGGYVSSLYYDITERGVCYSTSSSPTISNSVIKSGSGTGSFSCTLSNLLSETTYYYRAYAKYDDEKIVYGSIMLFNTIESCPSRSPSLGIYNNLNVVTNLPATISFVIDGYDDISNIGATYYISYGDDTEKKSIVISEYGEEFKYKDVYTVEELKALGGKIQYTYNKSHYDLDKLSWNIEVLVVGCNPRMYKFASTSLKYLSSKLYFIDSQDWDSVGIMYTYIWNSANDDPNVNDDAGIYKWPGVKANKESITYNGYSIYSFDISGFNADYIIFNSYDVSYGNYRYKTKDLKIDLSKPYYYEGSWYGSLSEIP